MGIEDTFLLIVFPMDLQKMRAKIIDNSFIFVGAVAEGCNAEWDSSQAAVEDKLERRRTIWQREDRWLVCSAKHPFCL